MDKRTTAQHNEVDNNLGIFLKPSLAHTKPIYIQKICSYKEVHIKLTTFLDLLRSIIYRKITWYHN